jgi:RHS repeat-associated protein
MAYANPFRFSTKYQDDETDLLYYGRRYYTASTGRWISRDPIDEKGSLNLFASFRNDPANRYDALGSVDAPTQAPPLTDDQCCEAARKNSNVSANTVAGITCCGGLKYVCVWNLPHYSNTKALNLLEYCTHVHETQHLGDTVCPKCKDNVRGEWGPRANHDKGECNAHTKEFECEVKAVAECGGDPECEREVKDYAKATWGTIGLIPHCKQPKWPF